MQHHTRPFAQRRRTVTQWMACMAMACVVSAPAQASDDSTWQPSKNLEFIVPGGAGAALDMAARKLTEVLAKEGITSNFVVTNKPGAHSIQAGIFGAPAPQR